MFEYLTSRRLLHANLLILGVSRIINIWVLLLLSAGLPWLQGELPDETLLGRLLAELLLRGGVVGRPALGRVVGILLLNARLLQVGVIALLKLGEELHLRGVMVHSGTLHLLMHHLRRGRVMHIVVLFAVNDGVSNVLECTWLCLWLESLSVIV